MSLDSGGCGAFLFLSEGSQSKFNDCDSQKIEKRFLHIEIGMKMEEKDRRWIDGSALIVP
jgi:hypothetical protein